MIGIFLADGNFFPILDESEGGAKRLVLSPARDGQERIVLSVVSRTESEERYLGSLSVDSACDEAVVDMMLRDGTLLARLSCGDSVSNLKIFIDNSESYSMPDVEILSDAEKDALVDEMIIQGDMDAAGDFSEWEDDSVKKSRSWVYWFLLIAGVLLAITACLAAAYLVYVMFFKSEPVPSLVFSSASFVFGFAGRLFLL